MRKILTRILSVCLLFTLFGCSSSTVDTDDVNVVFDALDTTLNAKSGILTGTFEYDTKTDQKINFTIQLIQNGNMQIAATMGLESQGNKIDDYLDFYIKDGKTYLNNMGTTSQSLASNIGIDTSKTLSVYNPFLDLTDSEIKALFTSSSKKDNTYTLVIDSEQLTTLLDGMGTLSISKAKVIATVEKDHLSNLQITIDGYQAYEETSYDVSIQIDCTLTDYNALNKITFPEDLENY